MRRWPLSQLNQAPKKDHPKTNNNENDNHISTNTTHINNTNNNLLFTQVSQLRIFPCLHGWYVGQTNLYEFDYLYSTKCLNKISIKMLNIRKVENNKKKDVWICQRPH